MQGQQHICPPLHRNNALIEYCKESAIPMDGEFRTNDAFQDLVWSGGLGPAVRKVFQFRQETSEASARRFQRYQIRPALEEEQDTHEDKTLLGHILNILKGNQSAQAWVRPTASKRKGQPRSSTRPQLRMTTLVIASSTPALLMLHRPCPCRAQASLPPHLTSHQP